MAAALLAAGPTVLDGVPDIVDVRIMAELLRRLGCGVTHDPVAGRGRDRRPGASPGTAPTTTSSARCGPRSACWVRSWPGWARPTSHCPAGTRSARAGSTCTSTACARWARRCTSTTATWWPRAPAGGLRGTVVPLAFPSVGATENLLMAAVLADGRSEIDNAAREPEIDDLAEMLTSMGARIGGMGTIAAGGRGRRAAVADPPQRRPGPDRRRHLVLRHRGRRRRRAGARRAPRAPADRARQAAPRGRRRRARTPPGCGWSRAAVPAPSTSPRCRTRGSPPTSSRSR